MKLFIKIKVVVLLSALFSLVSLAANAPNFSALTLDGTPYEFDAGSIQKPHLIVFWASWCRECRYEFQPLSELHMSENEQLKIIGVSIDKDVSKAQEMAKEASLPYLNIRDPKASIAKLFNVKGTPTLLLIDQSGELIHQAHRLDKNLLHKIDNTLAAAR